MKVLLRKSTGEFVKYLQGDFYSGDVPTLLSDSATLETLVQYAQQFDEVDLSEVINDLEIKSCKIVIE